MMSADQSQTTLRSRLEALECHFTWILDPSRISLLLHQDKLVEIGTEEGNSWLGPIYNLRGFIQCKLGSTEDALSSFLQAAEAFRQMRRADEGPWLVVNYGNLAWLHHFLGHQAESEDYLSKVDALKNKYPTPSEDDLHAELYAEKAWTLMMFDLERELVSNYFQKAIEMQPDMVEWNTSHVIELVRAIIRGSTEMEADIFDKMRDAKEKDPGNLFLAASCLRLRAKKGEDVKDEPRELAERVSINPVSRYSEVRAILNLYRTCGLIDEAIDLAAKALENNPGDSYLKRFAALTLKWRIVFFSNRGVDESMINRAVSLHKERISLYPDSSFVEEMDLANIYAKSKHGQAEATRLFQELLERELEPAEKQVLYNKYANHLSYDLKDYNKSTEYHMKAAVIPIKFFYREDSIKVLVKTRNMGIRCRETEEFLERELASDYFQKAIKMQPDMVEWNISHVIELASAFVRGSTEMEAEPVPGKLCLAAYCLQLRAKKGEDVKDEARELAERISINPVSSYSDMRAILNIYRTYGLIDEAILLTTKAVENNPGDSYLKIFAALTLKWKILSRDSGVDESMINRAVSLHKEVISLYPDSSFVEEMDLANIYAKSKHGQAEATRLFQELLKRELEPADKQVLYYKYANHLYFNLKDNNRSREYHRKAAAIPIKSIYRKKSIKVLEKSKNWCREIGEFLENLQEP